MSKEIRVIMKNNSKKTETMEWSLLIRVDSDRLIESTRSEIARLINEGFWNGVLEQPLNE